MSITRPPEAPPTAGASGGKPKDNASDHGGRTRGTYMTEDGSLAVHKDVEIELIRRFGDGWGDKKFQITETIGLPDGTNSITVVESCRFKGSGGGGEKGNSALTRELPFSFMRIKRDGKYLVAGNR